MSQITTITFFRYEGLLARTWAFGMMQFAHAPLSKIKGLSFYKLLGTGKGHGFNPLPDWSTYALLQVWESEEEAEVFFKKSSLLKRYQKRSAERLTIFMKSIVAKGFWSKKQPFKASVALDDSNSYLAVITRASIRPSKLFTFWKYVPTSQKPLVGNEGLIFTKGIGEAPIFQMATFSLWKDEASLKQFAYQSREHQLAIKKTQELDWYSEELFSRFQPYRTIGTWRGRDVLPELQFR